jgi:hypothetical protein
MEAARSLINFYHTTRCYNREDSRLRTHRRENLKSYIRNESLCNFRIAGDASVHLFVPIGDVKNDFYEAL